MKKVKVYGKVIAWVGVEIEVDDNATEDDIIDKAYDEFEGVSSYYGNGGTDKLIGVSASNHSIEVTEGIEFAPNGEEDIEYLD